METNMDSDARKAEVKRKADAYYKEMDAYDYKIIMERVLNEHFDHLFDLQQSEHPVNLGFAIDKMFKREIFEYVSSDMMFDWDRKHADRQAHIKERARRLHCNPRDLR